MNKIWMKRIVAAMLGVFMVAFCLTNLTRTVSATDQSDVDEAQNQADETKKRVDALKKELANLKDTITDAKEYIAKLDNTLAGYTVQLYVAQQAIDAKQLEIGTKQNQIDAQKQAIADKLEEIQKTQGLLDAAKIEQDEQYEAMKLRIQYMYECGEETFLDMIFSSEDMEEMLGKTEYIASITAYDRAQLSKMIENKNEISDLLVMMDNQKTELEIAENSLESEMAVLRTEESELLALKNDLSGQQAYVNAILSEKENALSNLENQESDASTALAMEEQKLKEQQAFAEAQKKRYEEEQAAAAAAGLDASKAASETLEIIKNNGGFYWPVPGFTMITTNYGPWIHVLTGQPSFHAGTDIAGGGINGTPIYAAYSGKVILSQYYYGYGNTVQISHGTGVVSQYSHCASLVVKEGDTVTRGQLIAYVGATGNVSGPHLHLALFVEGNTVDPMNYFTKN